MFFMQIGANDGKSADPIFNHNKSWTGIVVEPLPDVFERLKNNYVGHNDKITFENVAVSDKDGVLELYMPEVKDETGWTTKVATALKSSDMLIDSDLKKVEVPCLSLDNLIAKHQVKEIDLMVLDVEGFEWQILSNYSFAVKPKAIYMEIRFYNYHQLVTIYKKFIELGYRIFPEKDNCLMVLK